MPDAPSPISSLLDSSNPVLSLLSNAFSAGRVGVDDTPSPGLDASGNPLPTTMSPLQQSSGVDALLAAGQSLAHSAAPGFGPRQTPLEGLSDAMVAGRQADINDAMMGQQVQDMQLRRAIMQQNLARQQLSYSMFQKMLNAGSTPGVAPASGEAPSGAPGSTPAGASAADIAQLPDVQALPEATRATAAQVMADRGMSADEAAQYARMLKQESGGQQYDADGNPMKSKAGAIGAAQVMPGTFKEMADKYKIQGDPTDLLPNLQAGAAYFHEGVQAAGNLRDATIRYNGGPGVLENHKNGAPLPSETSDYLVKTGAPPAAPAPASSSSAAAPGGPATAPNDPVVTDPITGAQVPRSIVQAARGEMLASEGKEPGSGPKAYTDKISQFLEQRAALPVYKQSGPGTQTDIRTGQSSEAPLGPTQASPLTPAERQQYAPNIPENMDVVAQRYISGPMAGKIKSVEPIAPRSAGLAFQQSLDAQKMVDQAPAFQQWQQGNSRFDAVIASLNQNTRAGDQGAIESLAKVFDPGAVVHEGKLEMAASYGGYAQKLQEWLGKMTGSQGLPDDVRQQIANLAAAEMKTRDNAAMGAINRARAWANANGVDPAKVAPGFETSALTQDEAPKNAPAGVTYKQKMTYDPATRTFGFGEEASGGTKPPTPKTPATTAGAGGPGIGLTPEAMAGASNEGFARVLGDMAANPGRYSEADHEAVRAEGVRRGFLKQSKAY